MAEVGLAIVGAVDTGLKLSFGLYQLATTLAEAHLEIEALGADVSMTCNALNQVHTVLTRARGCRASTAAIDAALETAARCGAIFGDMHAVHESLRGTVQGRTGTAVRIRWVLKRPKLRLMQQSLQSCVALLHLMIASLNLSQDLANGSLAPESDEEARRQSINAGLLLAQQVSNQRLEAVEEEWQQSVEHDDDELDLLLPDVTQGRTSPSLRGNAGSSLNRRSQIVDGEIFRRLPRTYGSGRDERPTSIVLDELVQPQGSRMSTYSHRWSRFSTNTLVDSLDLSKNLQQRWATLAQEDGDRDVTPAAVDRPRVHRTQGNTKVVDQSSRFDAAQPAIKVRTATPNGEPTSSTGLGVSSSHDGGDGGPGAGPQVEIFKSFKVAVEDPCWKVLPAALRKYNIRADWRQYALYIVYGGGRERSIGLEEKPLALFKELDKQGLKPMFTLRKLADTSGGGSDGEQSSDAF